MELFLQFISLLTSRMKKEDDDVVIVCFGRTGTGKSTLMLHAYEEYCKTLGIVPEIENISQTKEGFAKTVSLLRDLDKKNRWVGNDEGNIARTEAMTAWNRDVIDLYGRIRGLRGFHWWNNPFPEKMDRTFVQERVNFVVLTDGKGKARRWAIFTQREILRIFDSKGNIKVQTLKDSVRSGASLVGTFTKYSGSLKEAYLNQKDKGMIEGVDAFLMKHGASNARLSVSFAASQLGCSDHTLKKALVWAKTNDKIKSPEDYVLSGSRWLLSDKGMDCMKQFVDSRSYSNR